VATERDESMVGTFLNSTGKSALRRLRPRTIPRRAEKALSPDGNSCDLLPSAGERLEGTDERD
jgi:hypothetical protein